MRKQIAAANWKMNLSPQEADKLVSDLLAKQIRLQEDQLVVVAVPFIYLEKVQRSLVEFNNWNTAAQDCSANSNGAYTGQVSAQMLSSIHIPYVVIGHSERRQYNHESNEELAQKMKQALAAGLKVIFCCGEPLEIREAHTENTYVQQQLEESLFQLSAKDMEHCVIAYEPIWAIGTGKTASDEEAQQMHAHIRNVVKGKFGEDIANNISILYGGSVKAGNARGIFSKPDVDGGLVGGASLVADDFGTIIQSLKQGE